VYTIGKPFVPNLGEVAENKAFGGGAQTWHRMQAAYDMAQALKKARWAAS